MSYLTIDQMKASILTKCQRKLSNNFPDYIYDSNLLEDYFDDAISIIKDWKNKSDTTFILSGNFDTYIQNFIIQSIGVSGYEGQSSSSANGISKTFIASPESNLKASISQGL